MAEPVDVEATGLAAAAIGAVEVEATGPAAAMIELAGGVAGGAGGAGEADLARFVALSCDGEAGRLGETVL